MKRSISIFLLLVLVFTFPAQGQERVDDQVVARIKMEGFQRSQVLDTLSYLTDVHGPRLKSSPGYKAARAGLRPSRKAREKHVNLTPNTRPQPTQLRKRRS